MKKQIIYSNLVPRLFAATLDLLLLSITVAPIISFVSRSIFAFVFKDFLLQQNIDLNNQIEVARAFYTPSFFEYLDISSKNWTYIRCIIFNMILNIIAIGAFFVGFWIYKGATPGKMLLKMKIVDSETFEQPTKKQLIKRFFGYFSGLFGIWFIVMTKQKQALHDKMAHTVVIKN